MPDHTCACGHCDPSLSPQGERRGEHHFAVRFGDTMHVLAYLDGVKLDSCYEADVDAGLAWVYREPKHRCTTCRRGPCAEIRSGSVQITARLPMPARST